ncbi:hypothetical protein BGZ95_001247 [Linnemannia exigua]|uniref:Prokaryotic-type class I peptide chain release factors domain-containing protein n=1 Tax=Linnemannia exigua TaxID=604196 RepID=A0AAD4DKL7_9FUNG|nr:hypothetical protein BGZ95_001247 [Linnemannia exigua]
MSTSFLRTLSRHSTAVRTGVCPKTAPWSNTLSNFGSARQVQLAPLQVVCRTQRYSVISLVHHKLSSRYPGAIVSSLEQQRGFASRKESAAEASESDSGSDEEFRDDNGMTLKDREKIENWAKGFTKDSIPKGLLTLNFVRASGPGGQNVNKGSFKLGYFS